MNTSLLLLVALLGLASALQPGLEYEYTYHSRVATGIPELQRQYAGAAIRASVTVQLLGKNLMAQITNIEVADMNGMIECDWRAALPLTYEPMSDYAETFEVPFLINGTDSLVVPHDEPYWITNIRKAVAILFTVKPLRTHEGEHAGLLQTQTFQDPVVVVDEDQSLSGICQHRYVLTKLPDYLKEEHMEYIKKTVEEDVQSDYDQVSDALTSKGGHSEGSKTGHEPRGSRSSKGGKGASKGSMGGKLRADVPKLGDDVYVLSRTINFDECHTMVKFQNYGHGIYCNMGSSQCGTLLSRSSTGSFVLRGSSEALRIEKVEIEGNVLMNPLGYETEKIRAVTNQTLELRAVRHQGTPLKLPASIRQVDSLMYEVESPVSSVRDSIHPFVHHQPVKQGKPHGFYPLHSVAGLPAVELEEMQSLVADQVKDLLLELRTTLMEFKVKEENHSNIAERMTILVDLIMILDYDGLSELFDSFSADDEQESFIREMLVDVMAQAGTDAAVRVLVEQIKSRAIGTERSAQAFMALSNSLQMPDHSFPHLLDLLKSLDMNTEFQLTSSLVLNIASAINRLCLSSLDHDSHQKLLLGHRYCNPRVILEQFLPIVEKGLQDNKNAGHSIVYVHALTMMTTEQKLPILKPIILGTTVTDVRVRALACYALQAYNTPAHTINEIFSLLMSVFEYQGEHHLVRASAVGSMLSWKPNSVWWHRMAVASWRDPSRQMQAYISHLIMRVSELNGEKFDDLRQRARHVLPMTKHFPYSKRFSMSMMTDAYLEAIETGVVFNIEWLHTVTSYIPSVICETLIVQQGSFLNFLYEFVLDADLDRLAAAKWFYDSGLRVNVKDASVRFAKSMYSKALMALRMDETTHFENLETPKDTGDEYILAVRIFYNALRVFTADFSYFEKFLPRIPTSWNLIKFINPVQIFVSFPTDIGLPFVGTVTSPTVLYTGGHIDLFPPVWKTNNFASFQVQTKAQVVTPWNGKLITSGIELRRDFTLPSLYISYLRIGVSIMEENKVSLMRRISLPFTARASLLPRSPLSEEEDYKIIHSHRKPFRDQFDLGKQYTGMALELEWVGDVESSFNLPYLLEHFPKDLPSLFYHGLSPTLQHYEYRVTLDPETSTTSGITYSFLWFRSEKKDTPNSEINQEGEQSQGEYDDSFQEFQESPGGEQVEPVVGSPYSVNDSQSERANKMIQQAQQMEFGPVNCFSNVIKFTGSEALKYDMVLQWATSIAPGDSDNVFSEAKITFLRGSDTETEHMACIDIQSSQPYISPLMDLPDTLDHDLRSTVFLKVREGENCTSAPVVEAEALIDMTQHRKETILSTLESRDFCAKDLETHRHLQAIYDDLKVHVTWSQDLDDCSPLVNFTQRLNDYAEAILFPRMTHNYCRAKNAPGVVTIDATRSIDTNLWTIWAHKPTETSLTDHLHLPDFIDGFISFDHDYHHTDHGIPTLHDECHIYEDRVNTFDGMTYPLEKSLCWRVLAMDVDHHESWMLLHRYVEHPERGTQLRFINPAGMIVADIKPGQVKVNGESVVMARDREVVRYDGRTLCIVETYKDQIFVEFPKIMAVSLKGSHVVVKMDLYTAGGLCGARDGEATADLQGPNRCVYSKPELFAMAWTARGDGDCDLNTQEDLVEKVEEYQQHCPKFHAQATGLAHD